jgi:SAM-dependent methyltransferase
MCRLHDLGIPPEQIAAAFDRHAASWDEEHGPHSLRRLGFALRAALLRDLLRRLPRRHVLDIGCATGGYLLALGDLVERGVGIDISPAMIERARRNAGTAALHDRLRFEILPVERLPASGHDAFDLVLLLGSLEHMTEPARSFAAASQVLRPGGLLAIVLLLPWHPRSLLAQHRVRRGTIPPFRPIPMRAIQDWAQHLGLVRLGLVERACGGTHVAARSCWALAATVMPLLGGTRMVVCRRVAHGPRA